MFLSEQPSWDLMSLYGLYKILVGDAGHPGTNKLQRYRTTNENMAATDREGAATIKGKVRRQAFR